MSDLHAAPTNPPEATLSDRRRPGRRAAISPTLIPLLRQPEATDPPGAPIEFEEPDQLSAARGLMAGAMLSAPLWAAVFYLGRWLF